MTITLQWINNNNGFETKKTFQKQDAKEENTITTTTNCQNGWNVNDQQ